MKATLYEALGILPTSSDEEVRAALRRLIRKYYAKTRDGQGNVEEALRFINHASRILSDSNRRVRYDQELSLSTGTTEQKIANVVSNAVAEAGEQTDVGTATAEGATESGGFGRFPGSAAEAPFVGFRAKIRQSNDKRPLKGRFSRFRQAPGTAPIGFTPASRSRGFRASRGCAPICRSAHGGNRASLGAHRLCA